MRREHDNGLSSERKVIAELRRRGVPYRHRVTIDHYEIDVLVGKRIVIEVDGYVHLTRDSVTRDRRKDMHLRGQGFTVLRITGNDVKNRGILRDFGRKVQELWKKEQALNQPVETASLTQTFDEREMQRIREGIARREAAEKERAKRRREQKRSQKRTQSKSDAEKEFFEQWLNREFPSNKG